MQLLGTLFPNHSDPLTNPPFSNPRSSLLKIASLQYCALKSSLVPNRQSPLQYTAAHFYGDSQHIMSRILYSMTLK